MALLLGRHYEFPVWDNKGKIIIKERNYFREAMPEARNIVDFMNM
jgi:hypothetical protein